jgi:uncharacterized BrkB/YihY/UPF0761 family membrane protein
VLGSSHRAETMNQAAASVLGSSHLAETMNQIAVSVLGSSHLAETATRANSAESDSSVQAVARHMISRREIAAYLTIVTFFLVYISLSLAISRDPQLAALSQKDGPTPFEAAMAVGALTFWAVMSWRRDD